MRAWESCHCEELAGDEAISPDGDIIGFPLAVDASRFAQRTGERWFEAELNRHKGRLLPTAGAHRGRWGIVLQH
jgi:hypothetical protein